ncbi:MAG: hypothetical protein GJ676_09055 [Rhodobacteraceae bacterium]|nr:hypothetical protein [Paracoccaceae bacterium]
MDLKWTLSFRALPGHALLQFLKFALNAACCWHQTQARAALEISSNHERETLVFNVLLRDMVSDGIHEGADADVNLSSPEMFAVYPSRRLRPACATKHSDFMAAGCVRRAAQNFLQEPNRGATSQDQQCCPSRI